VLRRTEASAARFVRVVETRAAEQMAAIAGGER
jgi:hypothetical protein